VNDGLAVPHRFVVPRLAYTKFELSQVSELTQQELVDRMSVYPSSTLAKLPTDLMEARDLPRPIVNDSCKIARSVGNAKSHLAEILEIPNKITTLYFWHDSAPFSVRGEVLPLRFGTAPKKMVT
jgi:hypothetical protein